MHRVRLYVYASSISSLICFSYSLFLPILSVLITSKALHVYTATLFSLTIYLSHSSSCFSHMIILLGVGLLAISLNTELLLNLFISACFTTYLCSKQRSTIKLQLLFVGRLSSGSGSSMSYVYTSSVGTYMYCIFDLHVYHLHTCLGILNIFSFHTDPPVN